MPTRAMPVMVVTVPNVAIIWEVKSAMIVVIMKSVMVAIAVRIFSFTVMVVMPIAIVAIRFLVGTMSIAAMVLDRWLMVVTVFVSSVMFASVAMVFWPA